MSTRRYSRNCAGEFAEKNGRKLETYSDFRKLLERKDIDAVSIATPNHTHSLIAICRGLRRASMSTVEKPASHNVWEGRQMVQPRGRTTASCSAARSRAPAEPQGCGRVSCGAASSAKSSTSSAPAYKPRPQIGKLDKPLVIPKSIDYDLWCGPAAQGRASTGPSCTTIGTGTTTPATATWATRASTRWISPAGSSANRTLAPRTISIGGRLGYEDAGNTPNTQIVLPRLRRGAADFRNPRPAPVESGAGEVGRLRWIASAARGVGVIVQCETGTCLVPSYVEACLRLRSPRATRSSIGTIRTARIGHHMRNFLGAVAANDSTQLNADIHEGHLSSSLCHLGSISHRLGTTAPAGRNRRPDQGQRAPQRSRSTAWPATCAPTASTSTRRPAP